MDKLEIIRQARRLATSNNGTHEGRLINRERLRKLVKQHGYDATAAATGWKVSSISQYLRNKSPLISEKRLSDAENILANT